MNQIINKPKALIVEDSASLAAFYCSKSEKIGG